jgi:hypothetical protein
MLIGDSRGSTERRRLDTLRPKSYDGVTVAVTVEQVPFVVLDESYRIVEVGPAAEAGFGPLHGRCVWDCFPGSESMYRPHYERARRRGESIELVQYYGGYLTKVEIRPEKRAMRVSWEILSMLDTSDLERLRASLTDAIAALDQQAEELDRRRLRGTLRVVEGTA